MSQHPDLASDAVPGERSGARSPQLLEHAASWAVALSLSFIFCLPVFGDLNQWGIGDWDQHFFYHAVARRAILEGQMPGWNPFYFGGTICLANPQSRMFSPWFGLELAFGVVVGLKLDLWLHLAFGLVGAFRLARRLALGHAAAATAAAVAMLSSMYFLNLMAGHTWFMATTYGPWVWLAAMRARRGELEQGIVAGTLLALAWLDGGAYVVAILLVLLVCQALAELQWRRWRVEAAAAGLIGLAAGAAGAVKLLPSVHFMRLYPRPTDTWAGYSFWGLARALLDPGQSPDAEPRWRGPVSDFWHGLDFGMQENGMYVGPIALGLFLLGLVSRPRRGIWLPLVVLTWILWGYRAPYSLWEWLHEVPPFAWMRVAMRFRIAWILPVAVLCGFGMEWLRGRLPARWRTWLPAVLLAALAADLYRASGRLLADAFTVTPYRLREPGPFVQLGAMPRWPGAGAVHSWREPTSTHYPAFLANTGIIHGYEPMPIPKHPVPSDDAARYRGELFLLDGGGSARFDAWTLNELGVTVETDVATRLVVNQNYYPGWREVSHGWPVQPHEGLISVPVPAGPGRLRLRYDPPWFGAGLVITAAALPLLPALACLLRRRSPAQAADYTLPQAFVRFGSTR